VSPEDKWGPAGYDAPETPAGSERRYVTPGGTFGYRIEMWNKPEAPAPTQDATIYDVLDPNVFDLSTFQFTRVGFLKWDRPLPGGQTVSTRVDCRPEMNLAVDITGTFDPETGRIDWWFHAVDPVTGDYPDDPQAGFLPQLFRARDILVSWTGEDDQLDPQGAVRFLQQLEVRQQQSGRQGRRWLLASGAHRRHGVDQRPCPQGPGNDEDSGGRLTGIQEDRLRICQGVAGAERRSPPAPVVKGHSSASVPEDRMSRASPSDGARRVSEIGLEPRLILLATNAGLIPRAVLWAWPSRGNRVSWLSAGRAPR